MQRRVLAIYAHPDDEGLVGGTLAKFIAEGDQVTLLCTTRGEVGEISDPALATPDTLGYVRELELRAAMAQIGLWDVRFLPFRDSGMAGTPENDDPRSFVQQADTTVVQELVTMIRTIRPHFVFTWQPNGGYGHPDHLAAHRHTLAAYEAAGDAAAFPDAGVAWSPERLYWSAFTMKRFAGPMLEAERRGLLPEPIDPERRERFEKALMEPDPPVSININCAPFAAAKRRAQSMHRTQFGGAGFAQLPDDLRERMFSQEHFYQARPPWPEDAPPAQDFPEVGVV